MRAVMSKADRGDLEVRLCGGHQPDAAEAHEVQSAWRVSCSTDLVTHIDLYPFACVTAAVTHRREIIDLAGRRDGHAS
jgi:hypothetical protein